MPRPDEGLIHAWLDGELDAAEAARVEQLVAEDAEWGAAAAEARGLIAASSRILGALDVVPGDVIPGGGRAAPAHDTSRIPTPQVAPRSRGVPTWLRVAAGAVLVAGVGYLSSREGPGESGVMMVVDSPSVAAAVAAKEAATDAGAGAAASAVTEAPAPPSAVASASVRDAARTPRAEASPRADAPASSTPAPAQVAAVGAAPVAAPVAELARAAEERAAIADSQTAARRAESEAMERRARSSNLRLDQVVVTGAPAAAPQTPPTAPTVAPRRALADAPAAAQKTASTADAAVAAAPMAAPAATGAALAAAPANSATSIISGCWRVRTTGLSDTLLVTIPVVRQLGDTLVLRVTADGAEARVRRARGTALGATALEGTATTREGATVPFTASVVRCPRE